MNSKQTLKTKNGYISQKTNNIMGVINEKTFRAEITETIGNINKNVVSVNNKLNKIIESAKTDFGDAEKLLVGKILKTLDEKLKEYLDKELEYKNIKGSYGVNISFHIENWEEYKNYASLVYDDVFHKTINDTLKNSLKKYGFTQGSIFVSSNSYSYTAEFSYRVNTESWFPGVGGEGFFHKNKKV